MSRLGLNIFEVIDWKERIRRGEVSSTVGPLKLSNSFLFCACR